MGEPVLACDRCGYSGPAGPDGCPRCAASAAPAFRVPALEAPEGPDRFERSEVGPEATPPSGGYVDLDLRDEDGPPVLTRSSPPAVPPSPAHRDVERTARAFAVPVVPGPASAKSATPVLVAVGVGCLALIAVGAWFAGRSGTSPQQASTAPVPAAPAEQQAPSADPVPAPAAAAGPAQAHAQTQAQAPAPPAPASIRPAAREAARAEPRPARAERRPVTSPQPAQAEPAPLVVPAALEARVAPATGPVAAAAPAVAPAPLPVAPPPTVIEEAPRYPAEGFRRPQMAEPGCVQRSVRLPRDASSRLTGPVTVRFAVGTAGEVGLFQVLGDAADPRIAEALASAVRSCRFLPGADAQGTPTRLWVTMPIRFEP